MSMKIILWMQVWVHLSRWRMELIKLSLHLPVRGKKDDVRERKKNWVRKGSRSCMGKYKMDWEAKEGSWVRHWVQVILHRNPLSQRTILFIVLMVLYVYMYIYISYVRARASSLSACLMWMRCVLTFALASRYARFCTTPSCRNSRYADCRITGSISR